MEMDEIIRSLWPELSFFPLHIEPTEDRNPQLCKRLVRPSGSRSLSFSGILGARGQTLCPHASRITSAQPVWLLAAADDPHKSIQAALSALSGPH